MRRVARQRLVFFTWWPERVAEFWLLKEYLPEVAKTDAAQAVPMKVLTRLLSDAHVTIRPVPVPHDCIDGFGAAFWRRPEAYLDPHVQAGISMLAKTDPDLLRPGLAMLAEDLRTGRWRDQHAELIDLGALDVGMATVSVDL